MWTQISPASVYVIPAALFLLVGIYKGLGMCCCDNTTDQDDEIRSKSLDPFEKSLATQTRNNWLSEVDYNKKRLDLPKHSIFSYARMAHLKGSGTSGKAKLKGLYTYDMLANSEYADLYHYVPCFYPQRNGYIISEFVEE